MAKLTKDLFGVVDGAVYPATIAAGADCPPELLAAAYEAGALSDADAKAVTIAAKAAKQEEDARRVDEAAAVAKGGEA